MHVTLRPSVPGDRAFLEALYSSVRASELAIASWSAEQRTALLQMQYEARRRQYEAQHPAAQFDIVMANDTAVGDLFVDRRATEICVVDIALLPAWRSLGIGTLLLRRLADEAAAGGRTITLHVERTNPAQRLYERLGFVTVEHAGPYERMVLRPPATAGLDRESPGDGGLGTH